MLRDEATLAFQALSRAIGWCLYAARWKEAFEAKQAPRVVLRALVKSALSYCALPDLKRFAVDLA
jgi:uncharacterized protein